MEYSVVYTDRSLNHMSLQFRKVMNDISAGLKQVYNAEAAVVVPGGGTYAMEAVARQFATDRRCLVIRNGYFSYRWSQIFESCKIPREETVLKARAVDDDKVTPSFAPAPIKDVMAVIGEKKPEVVFAAHVETAAGMMLPDEYIRSLAEATHAVGGVFVLDCIASGCIWVDMQSNGVDVLISAPQKGWTSTPCAGLVMLRGAGLQQLSETTSTSFALDLKKWHQIMQAYENGGHAYHATMPTDSLKTFRDVLLETKNYGFEKVREEQFDLGRKVRALLVVKGFKSVAAEGYQAPGVVVSYTSDPKIKDGSKFVEAGIQIAAGVPLMIGEPEGFQTFRIGLFGLDKLHNADRTVTVLADALGKILS